MTEEKTRKFNALRFELGMSYPFPSIICIFSLFIIIASFSLLSLPTYNLGIFFPIGRNSTEISEQLGENIRTLAIRASVTSILNSFYLVLLLVPLLVAFSFALGFSNGQIRTLLSYPIGRSKLILVKGGMVFLLTFMAVTVGSLFGMFFFYPSLIDIFLLTPLILSFWVTIFLMTAGCILIATLSKSTPVTIAGGISLWAGSFILYTMQSAQSLVMSVLFPVISTINYITPQPPSPISYMGTTPVTNVLFGNGVALLLAVLLFYLSIKVFQKLEV
jgi:hypothetical protein